MSAPEILDAELLAAMRDAEKRGVGWIRLLRITMGAPGVLRFDRIDPSIVVVLDDPTTYLDSLLAAALGIACPFCEAAIGQRCRTVSGKVTLTHADRSRPVMEAWKLGHRDGLVDALRRLVNDWSTPADELLARHAVTWS